jgi:mannosyltransferase OCH1-like enzyme
MGKVIPKNLHVIWVESDPPDWVLMNVQQWIELHPDWELNFWDDETMPKLYNQKLYDSAHSIVPPDAVGQFRADIARYEILYQFGGFYADVDTVPLRPIDDALEGHTEFAVAEDTEWVGNTYLGAEEGSTVMLALVRNMERHIKAVGKGRASVVSGPQYLTPIWKKLGCYVDKRTELWFPYSYADVKRRREHTFEISPDAYAIHSWNHTRELMGRDPS